MNPLLSIAEEERATLLVRNMLETIGDDPNREGLRETPSRVVRAWGEWFAGYTVNPLDLLRKDFSDGAENANELVLLTNIPVQSHCEHHITPIIGVAHVAYIPNGRIVGISKLARVVDAYARRLQVQERLGNQIADAIQDVLQPGAVGVVITAKHFCMATRGVKMPAVDTTTSALRGALKTDAALRAEFFSLIALARQGAQA